MSERRTVLVIDDEAMIRLTLTAYLEDSGYRVLEAADGEEGVELFRRLHPDIVLTDLRMPKLDGLGVIAVIKAESPATPVIAITGTGDPMAVHDTMALGALPGRKPGNTACFWKSLVMASMAASTAAARAST